MNRLDACGLCLVLLHGCNSLTCVMSIQRVILFGDQLTPAVKVKHYFGQYLV